jgi:Nucleotidyl transferase AbiEii toxin, Type IV TA system
MTSKHGVVYKTPAAFRRALTDKLRALVSEDGPWPLRDLQRQFAYDRLLARLYMLDDGWVLKGSTALLARHIAVRHTIDVDVYRAVSRDQAERDLRAALLIDGGDWFAFEAGVGRPIADGAGGTRIPVNARLGTTTWSEFHVDVVAEGIAMTGKPDNVAALTDIALPGLPQPTYRAYPLPDHIADKVCAILERQGVAGRPSTRFKDLVDLVTLVAHASPAADEQYNTFASEARRRGFILPRRFEVPDRKLWESGYAAEARRAYLPQARTLAEALAMLRPFIDPLLDRTAVGQWNPDHRSWEGID